ncbi:hypothetical protein JCM19000A_10510 [Silvimonas sp. JCM 19000]
MPMTAPALMLTVVTSRRACLWLRGMTVLALITALFLPWPWRLVMLLGVVCYQRRATPPYPLTVEVGPGGWTLAQGGQPARSLRWLPGTLITPQLVILHGRDRANGRFVALPIWADSVSADAHRQLRRLLRWGVRLDQAPQRN